MTPSPLLARWLTRVASRRPGAFDAAGATAWSELGRMADRAAATLLAGRSSLDGERVALLVAPGAAFVASLFGVLRAGGCAVVLSTLHAAPETRYFCEDAGVRTIIVSPEWAERVAFLAPERRLLAVPNLLAGPAGTIAALPGAGDAALQLYTSGTTGRPKGAVITHANVAVQQELLTEAWGLSEDDVLLHVLPLHHMHGLAIALLPAIGAGTATRFVAPFEAQRVWDGLAQATVFMAVPTIHAKLFAALDAAPEPTKTRWTESARALRLVTSGSAGLPVTVGERWRALTGAYPLERFGMTEIGVGLSNPLTADGRRAGWVGHPLSGVRTRVVGDDGRDAATGELWIAGPSVFARYHGRPDATDQAFAIEGGERWFKTGDTVERDHAGCFRILGRTSVDILKSGGYKLSALEIEEALREHPAVAGVAVVGLPDATWGDRVVACVVAREGREAECDEERVRAFMRERVAVYKVPKQVVLMRELPRNALGKVLKPSLVEELLRRAPPS